MRWVRSKLAVCFAALPCVSARVSSKQGLAHSKALIERPPISLLPRNLLASASPGQTWPQVGRLLGRSTTHQPWTSLLPALYIPYPTLIVSQGVVPRAVRRSPPARRPSAAPARRPRAGTARTPQRGCRMTGRTRPSPPTLPQIAALTAQMGTRWHNHPSVCMHPPQFPGMSN